MIIAPDMDSFVPVRNEVTITLDSGLWIALEGNSGAATVTSNLDPNHEHDRLGAAVDTLEALVLAQYCAGIDVTTEAYKKALETAINAIINRL